MGNAEHKVSGFFLLEDVKFVEQEKGQEGLVYLQILVPELTIESLSILRLYPLEQEIALLRGVAIVVFGDESEDSWKKVGKHDFDTGLKSPWGRNFFTILGGDPAKLLSKMVPIVERVIPYMGISIKDITKTGATFVTTSDPYPRGYFYGILQSLVEYFGGVKEGITVTRMGSHVQIYKLDWTH